MIYEISNPSDALTMASDDVAAACVACWYLGDGMYGLKDEEGRNCCPMLFGAENPNTVLKHLYGVTLDQVMAAPSRREAVAAALDSVVYGDIAGRKSFEGAIKYMTPENQEKYKAEYDDLKRTSMNNVGKRAAQLAKAIRGSAKVTA